jgi:hypothetical protein
MSVIETPRSQGLIARIIGILTRPRLEWDVIAAEHATTQGLFFGYAAILVAVPAIAQAVHNMMPRCLLGVCYTPNPIFAVVSAVVYYIFSLISVFLIGLIIDGLATSFGAEKNSVQAMKVAVYSWTAAWLAGIFAIIPWVGGLLSLVGLYSLFLLYLGLGQVMKSPADKSVVYTIVVIVLAIVVYVVCFTIVGVVSGIGMVAGGGLNALSSPGGTLSAPGGTIHLGNGGSIDLNKAEQSIKEVEAGAANGKSNAVDPQQLKLLLPDNIAGAPRTAIQASSGGAAGIGASDAEGTYQSGDTHITLEITDLAAIGGLTAFASAANVQDDKETATGYDKTQTINGQIVHESYDNSSKSGEYSVVVGNRFKIEADGSGVPIETLKGAVQAISPDRLNALAHG